MRFVQDLMQRMMSVAYAIVADDFYRARQHTDARSILI